MNERKVLFKVYEQVESYGGTQEKSEKEEIIVDWDNQRRDEVYLLFSFLPLLLVSATKQDFMNCQTQIFNSKLLFKLYIPEINAKQIFVYFPLKEYRLTWAFTSGVTGNWKIKFGQLLESLEILDRGF